MIEDLLYTHLQSCEVLTPYLAVYDGQKAVFNQEAPTDIDPLWEGASQYGRIVFSLVTSNDAERILEGQLAVDIMCEKEGKLPEEIEPILKPLIDGYFFSEEGMTVSAQWLSSDYFTTPDENIIGVTLMFSLLAYPVQITAEPDPVRLVNKWSYEELPKILNQELYVIGYGDGKLPDVCKPAKEKPVLYWRNLRTGKCSWIPDTWNCIWQTSVLQCHILTPTPEDAGRIARVMSIELTQKERLLFETRSPLFVDRNHRINLTNGSHRSGQLTIDATYGILRQTEQKRMNRIIITDQSKIARKGEAESG